MLKQLRKEFPFHTVRKIIRESADRKAVYSIVGAAKAPDMLVGSRCHLIEKLGMDWQIINGDIRCWK